MTDKAWNDPPLFSLEQMSRSGDSCAVNKRHRYPQPFANQQQVYSNTSAMNSAQTVNATQTYANAAAVNNSGFDLNQFMATINNLMITINTIPQQLRTQLPVIQQHLLNIQYDPRVQSNLLYLLNSINCRDFASARSHCMSLTQDSDGNLRSAATIIANILNYTQ